MNLRHINLSVLVSCTAISQRSNATYETSQTIRQRGKAVGFTVFVAPHLTDEVIKQMGLFDRFIQVGLWIPSCFNSAERRA
jgi:hypothetical protein